MTEVGETGAIIHDGGGPQPLALVGAGRLHAMPARLAGLGVPAYACTPDLFPDMMATAIRKQDLNAWAAGAGTAFRPPPATADN